MLAILPSIISGGDRSILGNLKPQQPSNDGPSSTILNLPQPLATLEPSPEAKDALAFEPKHLAPEKKKVDEPKKADEPKKDEPKKETPSLEKTITRKAPEVNISTKAAADLKKDQIIRFYFEDATLENVAHYIEELFEIKFFADDDIEPTPAGGSVLKGHKITFKTNQPLSRDEAWNLFLKFLDIAGLTVVPTERKKFYYITSMTNANKEVVTTYFDSKVSDIPDNSGKVRYVFFIKNAPLTTIQKIVSSFSSSTAQINAFPELNAMIVVDKGSSIRSLMNIVKEFDKEIPECMSVLKLKKADAQDVAKLYADLTSAENPQGVGKLYSGKNQSDSSFFPSNARVLAEPRTNSLIILGSRKAINKIEEFIKTTIDKSLDMPYSPLYIYELQYTQAENMQRILSSVVDFGASTAAGQFGGVRDGDQYFRPMTITADVDGNRLIIKAEESDYLKLKEMIQKLDVLQPQVAIEVLIVDVQVSDHKELGAQIRQKYPDQPFANAQFATSGMNGNGAYNPPVMPPSGSSLLGNLIALASNQKPGATLMSFGSELTGGVWGMLRVLETFGKTDVVSNPFLLTTNGYTAQVQLGTTRRIQTSISLSAGASQQGFQPIEANLTVTIKPQISTDGTIQMGIAIDITDFSSDAISEGNTTQKTVQTAAIVNDKEILVLGGVVKTSTSVSMSKVPILGDIPVVGWLFRNKEKVKIKSNLLIFISPHIIYSNSNKAAETYTREKTSTVKKIMDNSVIKTGTKDPINSMFFDSEEKEAEFGFLNNPTPHEHLYDAKKKRRRATAEITSKKTDGEPEKIEPKKQTRKERLQEKQRRKKQQKEQA